ncbi:MAG: hypothetical protein ACI93R_003263 [Flavobacteriales bacterium]|jgi:hypothetical protein
MMLKPREFPLKIMESTGTSILSEMRGSRIVLGAQYLSRALSGATQADKADAGHVEHMPIHSQRVTRTHMVAPECQTIRCRSFKNTENSSTTVVFDMNLGKPSFMFLKWR